MVGQYTLELQRLWVRAPHWVGTHHNDIMLTLYGIAGVFDDDGDDVKNHLRDMDFQMGDVVLSFNERAAMNFLISMPGEKIHTVAY